MDILPRNRSTDTSDHQVEGHATDHQPRFYFCQTRVEFEDLNRGDSGLCKKVEYSYAMCTVCAFMVKKKVVSDSRGV